MGYVQWCHKWGPSWTGALNRRSIRDLRLEGLIFVIFVNICNFNIPEYLLLTSDVTLLQIELQVLLVIYRIIIIVKL